MYINLYLKLRAAPSLERSQNSAVTFNLGCNILFMVLAATYGSVSVPLRFRPVQIDKHSAVDRFLEALLFVLQDLPVGSSLWLVTAHDNDPTNLYIIVTLDPVFDSVTRSLRN